MSTKRLVVGPPPYVRTRDSARRVFDDFLLALAPAALIGVYLYGMQAALLIAGCVAGAVAADVVGQRARGVRPRLRDTSAVVAGLLLALTLPPTLPVWMAFLAAVLAILIAKQTFGGLGENIFNPVLVGRAILMLSYSAYMVVWVQPGTLEPASMPIVAGEASYVDLLLGNVPGWLGSTAAVAPILGGAYLAIRWRIPWQTPLAFVVAMGVTTLALGQDPLFHLLAAGTPLIVFFVVTDSVTSPISGNGRLVYGLGAGVLAGLMRVTSQYPEGTIFAILLMNAVTPLIDTYIRPRPWWKEAAS